MALLDCSSIFQAIDYKEHWDKKGVNKSIKDLSGRSYQPKKQKDLIKNKVNS